jgi:signal transduction histidine kinase
VTPEPAGITAQSDWIGRLVRLLLVFRALILLITVLLLPAAQRTFGVGVLTIAAAALSYVPLRYWSRISHSISRHPIYLAVEVLIATLILAAAGARSSFFFFTLGTAALAGVVYGRRGAIPFSALLIAAYELVANEGLPSGHPLHDAQSVVFAPLLYPIAVIAGIAARELVERGVRVEAELRNQTEVLGAERERLRVARELHDSLAKTVEGLAMTASVLPARCERDPSAAAKLARTLAEDARRAAVEARALMSDLRPAASELPLAQAVRERAEGFAARAGIEVEVEVGFDTEGVAKLSTAGGHELLRILGEALANAVRHGGATRVSVSLGLEPDAMVLRVADDGRGLPDPVDFERLKAAGHYGLAGMDERARSIGGTLELGPGADGGTLVTARVPIDGAALADGDLAGSGRHRPAVRLPRFARRRRAASARMRA